MEFPHSAKIKRNPEETRDDQHLKASVNKSETTKYFSDLGKTTNNKKFKTTINKSSWRSVGEELHFIYLLTFTEHAKLF